MDRRDFTYLKGRKLVAHVRKILEHQLEVSKLDLELASQRLKNIQYMNERNSLLLAKMAEPDNYFIKEVENITLGDIEKIEKCNGCPQCDGKKECLTVTVNK